MRLDRIFILTLALCVSMLAARADSTPSADCLAYQQQLKQNGWALGTVTVPEDWAHPEASAQVQVFYYSRGIGDPAFAGISPLVYFNGGPLADSHQIYENYLSKHPELQKIPIVMIDQRGNGCSSPLPQFEMSIDGARRAELYGTRAIVLDAEAIRKKLLGCNSKWRIFGHSFGGDIVHRYLEVAPEGVLAAYSHGSSVMVDGIESLKFRVLAQKRAAERYIKQYPGDETIIRALHAAISPTDCFDRAPDGTMSCGPGVVDFLYSVLVYDFNWPKIHAFLAQMYDPTTKTVIPSALAQAFPANDPSPSQADFVITSIVEAEAKGAMGDKPSCELADARLVQEGYDPQSLDQFLINECRMETSARYPFEPFITQITGADPFSASKIAEQLKRNPGLKFYLYSSQLDLETAPESYTEEVGILTQAQLGDRFVFRNFPNSDHFGAFTEQQVYDDIASTNHWAR